MRFITDLHVHSKYSRATSKSLDIKNNAQWAKWKGIDVVGTGDFTHPVWLSELKQDLEEDPKHKGLYQLKDEETRKKLGEENAPRFLLSVETSHIYKGSGQTRRVHLVTLAPDFSIVEQIQQALLKKNVNISSDGRPIMGLSCPEYMDLVLTVDENCLIIPAHIWTPWFSLYGSMSGFDRLRECFQEFSPYIYAIETGLSSDPAMNWRVKELDEKSIVSFSDAHSPAKLGREVTVIEGDLSYAGITEALRSDSRTSDVDQKTSDVSAGRIISTIEFYPEEGKYHYDGHRNCSIRQSPEDTAKIGNKCPACGKNLTLGVMHRVEDLAVRKISIDQLNVRFDESGVKWIGTPRGLKPPYAMLVPLLEILSEALNVGVNTKSVNEIYQKMINAFGSEFKVLLEINVDEIEKSFDLRITEAIRRVRAGELNINPGFDGEFGEVKIFGEDEGIQSTVSKQQQLF